MNKLFIKIQRRLFFLVFSFFYSLTFSQQIDSLKTKQLEEVIVSAIRANTETPVSFSNLTQKEIASRNLGQDIPVLMNYLPAVVTTSDAGNGFGYTGIRVRGADASRVNVTINGIPYNDAESHGTFWVNMPDFGSSVESLQLQRGVGTSTNGSGAFGASLNLVTKNLQKEAKVEIASSVGSFGSLKNSLQFSTGILNNSFEFSGRVSKIASDGYIDRASSDLKGYFFQGNYAKKNTLIKVLLFGGAEKTYQSWYGYEENFLQTLGFGANYTFLPTFNVAGIQYDDFGNFEGFYNNQTDNYAQDQAQLFWTENWSEKWSSTIGLHYTYGRGYYEEFVDDWYFQNILFSQESSFDFLGLQPIIVNGNAIESMDYVRQKWLKNDFYGATFSVNYKKNTTKITIGGAINKYEGNHFGKIIWAAYPQTFALGDRYYNADATKTDATIYSKLNYKYNANLRFFVDLQYRNVHYKADQIQPTEVNDTFHFFNPKAGLTYYFDTKNSMYLSGGIANKEPRRADYENNSTLPERLFDYELGWRLVSQKTVINANFYYMNYINQLVLTGALNDVGAPIYANSGKSYRVGLEVDASFRLNEKWKVQPNFAISENKNRDFLFERDGVLQNLGSTNIAFSPSFVAANQLEFSPTTNWKMNFLSKYVSTQYMGNIDATFSKLDSYFVSDYNVSYSFFPKNTFKSITVNGLVNNIFNVKYSSNGYFYTYDDDFSTPGNISTIEGRGVYPQAGIHFLMGVTFVF